jgi:hypothetical protein
MKTIVLCGDSYYDYDDRYVGLHWADRLSPHNVYRLARGGASNFSIWHQIQYSVKFNPDLVLISFTTCPRIEFPKSNTQRPVVATSSELEELQWSYRNTVYDNVDHALPMYNNEKFVSWLPYHVDEYEILKNCIYIKSALDTLINNGIRFYFTLGGFSNIIQACKLSYADFNMYSKFNLLPNGANHPNKLSNPYFHIEDEKWHHDHAELIKGLL